MPPKRFVLLRGADYAGVGIGAVSVPKRFVISLYPLGDNPPNIEAEKLT
jgi:hypothetical protein